MANQTQKQKAAAARAAKAAEEAALKEQQAAQSGEGDAPDPVESQLAAEDKKEEVSENETETEVAEDEQQPDPMEGQDGDKESDEAPKEVKAVAFTKGEVSEVQGTEIKVQPRVGLDNTVPAPEFGKVDTKELVKQIEKDQQAVTPPPAPAIAKSSPSMKRVTVKPTDDVNIDTISTEEYFQMKHQYVFGTGSADLQEIIAFLDRYEDTMARGKVVDERVGASLQQQLYRNYLRALMLPIVDRNIAMDYILWKFFKNEKSAYRPHAVVRFTRSSQWDIDELKMFTTLNTIFQAIAHPSERVLVLREYKLGAMVSKFPTDKARYTEAFLSWTQTYR